MSASQGLCASQGEEIVWDGKGWHDVEADEATFDKLDISKPIEVKSLVKSKNCTVMWEQWAGIIQRDRPQTFVLRKLIPRSTVKRAPWPGAVRRVEWKGIATLLSANRKFILHTNFAKR